MGLSFANNGHTMDFAPILTKNDPKLDLGRILAEIDQKSVSMPILT